MWEKKKYQHGILSYPPLLNVSIPFPSFPPLPVTSFSLTQGVFSPIFSYRESGKRCELRDRSGKIPVDNLLHSELKTTLYVTALLQKFFLRNRDVMFLRNKWRYGFELTKELPVIGMAYGPIPSHFQHCLMDSLFPIPKTKKHYGKPHLSNLSRGRIRCG